MSEQLSRGYRIFLKIRETIELMGLEAYGDGLILKDIVVHMSPWVLFSLLWDCRNDNQAIQTSYQTPGVYQFYGYPIVFERSWEEPCRVVIHFTAMEPIGELGTDLETPWGPSRMSACITAKRTMEVDFEW